MGERCDVINISQVILRSLERIITITPSPFLFFEHFWICYLQERWLFISFATFLFLEILFRLARRQQRTLLFFCIIHQSIHFNIFKTGSWIDRNDNDSFRSFANALFDLQDWLLRTHKDHLNRIPKSLYRFLAELQDGIWRLFTEIQRPSSSHSSALQGNRRFQQGGQISG
jgi:hypothetical protein